MQNPDFVLENWGERGVSVCIAGETIAAGGKFRARLLKDGQMLEQSSEIANPAGKAR